LGVSSWCSTVLLVADLLHPVDGLAVELFHNGDVRHGRGRRGAVPMFLSFRSWRCLITPMAVLCYCLRTGSPFLHPTPCPRRCRRRRRDKHGTSLLTQRAGPHLAIRGAAACRRSACWFCIAHTCLPTRRT